MSQRQAPFATQLRGAVRRTVRSCASAVEPLATAAAGNRTGGESEHADEAARSVAASDLEPVDPAEGPTNRAEIVERGLSPEEYIRAVLLDHDGRIKQRQLIDVYGWAPSTASRLLSDLEDRDAIERYRLGREKIVCLPDSVPTCVS